MNNSNIKNKWDVCVPLRDNLGATVTWMKVGIAFQGYEKDHISVTLNASPIPFDGKIKLFLFEPKEKTSRDMKYQAPAGANEPTFDDDDIPF